MVFQTVTIDSVVFQTVTIDSVVFQTVTIDSVVFQTATIDSDTVSDCYYRQCDYFKLFAIDHVTISDFYF